MKTHNLVGLFVLLVLVAGGTIAASISGVSNGTINVVFGGAWLAASIYAYHYICVRNRDSFTLYVKLTSRGGKGPGLFEKSMIVLFGPYFLWSHGVWPRVLKRIGRD